MGQGQKTLMSAFALFLTVISKVLFLEERMGTKQRQAEVGKKLSKI